ncbi:MAG: MFS transporter [Marinibacterium sp.]
MPFLRHLAQDLWISRAPAAGFASIGFLWAAMAAQVPDLKAQIGASDAAFGAVFFLSSVGSMMAMWIAPRIDHRLGRGSVSLPLAFTAAMFLLPGLTGTIVAFAAAVFLVAAGSGVTDVLMNARVSELESDHGRPLMNLNHAVFSFAYAASAFLTGFAREAGWPPAIVFAIASAVVLLLATATRQKPRRFDETDANGSGHSRNAPVVWLAGIVVLVAFMSESSVEGWSALHLERTLGGDPGEGALGPALLGLTMGIGRLSGQVLAARFRDWVLIGLACVLSASGLVLAALAPRLALAYLGFAAMGLGISVVAPLALAMVGRMVDPSVRVAAIGRAALIGFAAFSLGPGLMGLSAQAFGLPAAFLIVSAFLMLTAVLIVPQLGRLSGQSMSERKCPPASRSRS